MADRQYGKYTIIAPTTFASQDTSSNSSRSTPAMDLAKQRESQAKASYYNAQTDAINASQEPKKPRSPAIRLKDTRGSVAAALNQYYNGDPTLNAVLALLSKLK